MKENNEPNNSREAVIIIGAKAKLFFERYAKLEAMGLINEDLSDQFEALAGDKDAFYKQVFIIRDQAKVSLEDAIGGTLFIRANEKLRLADPLTLPWLN